MIYLYWKKNKKNIDLSSAELAQSVENVNSKSSTENAKIQTRQCAVLWSDSFLFFFI